MPSAEGVAVLIDRVDVSWQLGAAVLASAR